MAGKRVVVRTLERVWIFLFAVVVGCNRQSDKIVPADPQTQPSSQQPALSVNAQETEAILPDGELSPEAIINFLNAEKHDKQANLWRRLKIKDGGYSKGEKFEFDLGQAGKLLVIRVGEAVSDRHFRYLFFRSTGINGWHFVSYHDEIEQKYGPPKQRVEMAGNQVWFVLRSLGSSGSGLSWYYFLWLNIDTKEAKTDLRFPDTCETYTHAEPTICESWEVAGKEFVKSENVIRFEGRFSWSGGEEEIFTKRGTLVYTWNTGKKALEFDRKRSTISQTAWSKYSSKNDAGFNRSIKLYYADLLNVALRGNQRQKAWLKGYLEQLKGNSSQRLRLLRAISLNQ